MFAFLPTQTEQSPTPPAQHMSEENLQELGLGRIKDSEVVKEVGYIINELLSYPSSREALLHQHCNKLGIPDTQPKYCKCCGLAQNCETIPLCDSFADHPDMGISTYLYFQTLRSLLYLLLFLCSIFGLYALATNVILSEKDTFSTLSQFIITISLASKHNQQHTLYLVQMWLGVLMILVWGLALGLMQHYSVESQIMVDEKIISVADFSVVIEGYPSSINQHELQQQLNQYGMTLPNPSTFHISKMSIGKVLEFPQHTEQQLQSIHQEYESCVQEIATWLDHLRCHSNFPNIRQAREVTYQQVKTLLEHKQSLSKNLLDQTKQTLEDSSCSTMAIISFTSTSSRNTLLEYNSMNWVESIRYYLQCWKSNHSFILTEEDKAVEIKIKAAPEPQDILWKNLSLSKGQQYIRKVVTYLATILLLGGSFMAVYYLSVAQANHKDILVLSLVISLVIGVINVVIGMMIKLLSEWERDDTETSHQTSLAIKSICGQVVNSVVVPVVANHLIQDNIYGENGLVDDVFFLAITNCLLPPLLKLLQLPYLVHLVVLYYYSRVSQQIKLNQVQLNNIYELPVFETGYEYIAPLNIYLFVCFYVSLQPVVVIFGLIGLSLFYLTQKWNLFNRFKRPIPGTGMIDRAVFQLVSLGPIFYSLGALTWSHFLDTPSSVPMSVPNILAASLSAILFIFPIYTILGFCSEKPTIHPNLKYKDCRLIFASQYDRVNPATAQAALEEYEHFLNDAKNKQNDQTKLLSLMATQNPQLSIDNLLRRQQAIKKYHRYQHAGLMNILSQNQKQEKIVRNILQVVERKKTTPTMVQEPIFQQQNTLENINQRQYLSFFGSKLALETMQRTRGKKKRKNPYQDANF